MLAAVSAGAQRGKKDQQEFTPQGLLIVNFAPRAGADMKLGRKAADAVRSRVGRLVDKKEVNLIDAGDVGYRMERAGYNPDTTYDLQEIRSAGKYFRADEFVMASVSNGPAGPRLSGSLMLLRDERLRQPLPDATAPKLDSAAVLFARSRRREKASTRIPVVRSFGPVSFGPSTKTGHQRPRYSRRPSRSSRSIP